MQTAILGRTGLKVSIACLGAGGHSRLGRRAGATEAEAADLVRAAVDRGITIVDTAPGYGTEALVGAGLKGIRDGVVVSSKARATKVGSSYDTHDSLDFVTRQDLRDSVEASLSALRTDRIDILHMHGVRPQQYAHCRDVLLPELARLRDEGKIRYLGITEGFGVDQEHRVMHEAVADGAWDVLMLGYNFVNPSAAKLVLPAAREKNIGIMCMYAVRGALANRDSLKVLVEKLIRQGEVDAANVYRDDPGGFLVDSGTARSLTEAAYRFCRHTPGIDVVMTGTGNLHHLEENIASIGGGPLPPEILQRLASAFGNVRTATGDPETPAAA